MKLDWHLCGNLDFGLQQQHNGLKIQVKSVFYPVGQVQHKHLRNWYVTG